MQSLSSVDALLEIRFKVSNSVIQKKTKQYSRKLQQINGISQGILQDQLTEDEQSKF